MESLSNRIVAVGRDGDKILLTTFGGSSSVYDINSKELNTVIETCEFGYGLVDVIREFEQAILANKLVNMEV